MSEKLLKRYSYDIVSNDYISAGKASSLIKSNLKSLGINAVAIRKLAIISYEAEINIVIHSYGGQLHCNIFEDKIEIISQDRGPGIKDIELALSEGYSTASDKVRELGFGAGMGLPNMKRYSDEFFISSTEEGTLIKIGIIL